MQQLMIMQLEAAEEEAVHMKTNSTVLAKAPESSQAYKNGKREEGKYEFTEVFDSQVTQKYVSNATHVRDREKRRDCASRSTHLFPLTHIIPSGIYFNVSLNRFCALSLKVTMRTCGSATIDFHMLVLTWAH